MDVFDSRYYKINKLLLTCIGRWTYHTGLRKRIPQVLIVFSLTITVIPQALYLYLVRNDLDKLLESSPSFLIKLIAMSQLCVFILNDSKVRIVLDTIKADWNIRTESLELEILKNYAEAGRFYTWLYTANVCSSFGIVLLMSLTNPVLDILVPLNESRIRQPVFEAVLPFNQTKHFYWGFLYSAPTALFNITIIFSCESLFAVTTLHACGLFSIVSYRLKRITEQLDVRKICEDQNIPDSIFQELIHLIEGHNHALNFARTLDTAYSPFLFVTVLINVVVSSTSGLGILTSLGQLDKVIRYGGYTAGVFFHSYCITLPPQKLLDHSVDLARSAYDVFWYKLPIKSRKILLLLIKRSQKPSKMTAGKFYNMDMETFSSVIIE